jgi:hypothetical protein
LLSRLSGFVTILLVIVGVISLPQFNQIRPLDGSS